MSETMRIYLGIAAFWATIIVATAIVAGCVVEPARIHVPEVCAGRFGGTHNGGLVIEPPHECGGQRQEAPRYEHRRGDW